MSFMARTIRGSGRMGASSSAPSPGAGAAGAPRQSAGAPPGRRQVVLGDEAYLWILVLLEVAIMAYFRTAFRRHHGG